MESELLLRPYSKHPNLLSARVHRLSKNSRTPRKIKSGVVAKNNSPLLVAFKGLSLSLTIGSVEVCIGDFWYLVPIVPVRSRKSTALGWDSFVCRIKLLLLHMHALENLAKISRARIGIHDTSFWGCRAPDFGNKWTIKLLGSWGTGKDATLSPCTVLLSL